MDDVQISAEDQERIDNMVSVYRNQITNLYKMAFLQGEMAQLEAEQRKTKAALAAIGRPA